MAWLGLVQVQVALVRAGGCRHPLSLLLRLLLLELELLELELLLLSLHAQQGVELELEVLQRK